MKRLASLWLGMAAMTVSLFAGALLFSASASAQTTTPSCYPDCTNVVTPQVTNSFASTSPSDNNDGTNAVAATGTAPVVASASSSTLAFTGADVAGTVIVATILIAGGLVLLQVGRRRRNA